MALPTSVVTVPTLGLGILPCGPRIRPSRPTTGIRSGVAIATSKSVHPSCIRFARSSSPTTSAPAASASRALSPFANTATVTSVPAMWGSVSVPPRCLLDQHRRGRCLGDERERAILEDRDLHRDDAAVLVLRLGVERLAELHDVHAVLTERGTHRGRRVGGPAGNLQFDEREDFFG